MGVSLGFVTVCHRACGDTTLTYCLRPGRLLHGLPPPRSGSHTEGPPNTGPPDTRPARASGWLLTVPEFTYFFFFIFFFGFTTYRKNQLPDKKVSKQAGWTPGASTAAGCDPDPGEQSGLRTRRFPGRRVQGGLRETGIHIYATGFPAWTWCPISKHTKNNIYLTFFPTAPEHTLTLRSQRRLDVAKGPCPCLPGSRRRCSRTQDTPHSSSEI